MISFSKKLNDSEFSDETLVLESFYFDAGPSGAGIRYINGTQKFTGKRT